MVILLLGSSFTLHSQAVVVGSGHSLAAPVRLTPGGVTTLFVKNLSTKLGAPLQATSIPLPVSLGGISITIQGAQTYTAPLFSVQQTTTCSNLAASANDCVLTAVTIQTPFEVQGSSASGAASIQVAESGVMSQSFAAVITNDVHILTMRPGIRRSP